MKGVDLVYKCRRKGTGGYVYLFGVENVEGKKIGVKAEHRIVVEYWLGRSLKPYETVHHINGNIKDNRISNLEIINDWEHKKKHGLTKY